MYLMVESEVTMLKGIKKIFKYLFHRCEDDYHEEEVGLGLTENVCNVCGNRFIYLTDRT